MSIFGRTSPRFFARLATICGLALTLAACSGSGENSTAQDQTAHQVRTKVHVTNALHGAEDGSIADIVEPVLPSVVSVTTTTNAPPRSPMDLFFGGPGPGHPQQGLGSGVILSANGLVV